MTTQDQISVEQTTTSPANLALAEYVKANGPDISVGTRDFCVSGISSDGDIHVADFATKRARYLGVLCNKASVAGKPGAEVWSVIGNKKAIADFAVWQGQILAIRY